MGISIAWSFLHFYERVNLDQMLSSTPPVQQFCCKGVFFRLNLIETIQVHDLIPGGDKVTDELFLRV